MQRSDIKIGMTVRRQLPNGDAYEGKVLYMRGELVVADWHWGSSGPVWQEGVPVADVWDPAALTGEHAR